MGIGSFFGFFDSILKLVQQVGEWLTRPLTIFGYNLANLLGETFSTPLSLISIAGVGTILVLKIKSLVF